MLQIFSDIVAITLILPFRWNEGPVQGESTVDRHFLSWCHTPAHLLTCALVSQMKDSPSFKSSDSDVSDVSSEVRSLRRIR